MSPVTRSQTKINQLNQLNLINSYKTNNEIEWENKKRNFITNLLRLTNNMINSTGVFNKCCNLFKLYEYTNDNTHDLCFKCYNTVKIITDLYERIDHLVIQVKTELYYDLYLSVKIFKEFYNFREFASKFIVNAIEFNELLGTILGTSNQYKIPKTYAIYKDIKLNKHNSINCLCKYYNDTHFIKLIINHEIIKYVFHPERLLKKCKLLNIELDDYLDMI